MTDSGSEGAKHKCVKGINEIGTAWCTTHDQNWIHKDCEESAASNTGKPLRMNAYYYSFNETGSLEIDGILSAVAVAGKAFHHTQNWSDEDSNYGDGSLIDLIQNKAIAAANQIASLTERVKELESKDREQFEAYRGLQSQLDAANKRNEELEGTIKTLNTKLDARHEISEERERLLHELAEQNRYWIERDKCHSKYTKRMILYSDTLGGFQVGRDDLWAVSTEELNTLTRQLDKQGKICRDLEDDLRECLSYYKDIEKHIHSGARPNSEWVRQKMQTLQSAAEIREGKD